MQWMEWASMTAVAGAVCLAVYAAMARMMRRAVADKQRENDRQWSAIAATVQTLQARVAELGRLEGEQSESAVWAGETRAGQRRGSTEPETIAVLTAAATAFLGQKARIRSAQIASAEPISAGTWAQQGRAFVQTSHNPHSRR
ncbi:MAG TPA: hypothetical protein VGG45_14370 [Terracidiphilus sp.]|jgi:hypothetical protein